MKDENVTIEEIAGNRKVVFKAEDVPFPYIREVGSMMTRNLIPKAHHVKDCE